MNQQDHRIDIASLAQQLREELTNVNSGAAPLGAGGGAPPGNGIVIGKVSELTRNVDEQEYDPQYVSVGPYHRLSNPKLARDDDKMRSFKAILSAASPDITLEVFLNELARLEGRARRCYEDSFGMMSNEFVRVLLLDGSYILLRFGDVDFEGRWRQGLQGNGAAMADGHDQGRYLRAQSVLTAGGIGQREAVAVVRDVFYLAENQIPFFVIEKIHQLIFLDGDVPAVAGIARYVQELLRRQQYSVLTPPVEDLRKSGHLLHLLHMHFKPTVPFSMLAMGNNGGTAGKAVGRWRTATDYYFAGVKFKARTISAKGKAPRCILDVKLSRGGGTLEAPRLHIDSETWRLLRNLMALEQRNPAVAGSNVTAYCVFMSQIACTTRDVELLSKRGVIVHGHGNHGEVAGHFADLCKGVQFDADDPRYNYLRPVWQALEKRVQCRPRRWAALLSQKYFSNPWLVVGLFAGSVGLFCTIVQAAYAVLSYKP